MRALLLAGLCAAAIELFFALRPQTVDPQSVYPFFYIHSAPSVDASIVHWQTVSILSHRIPKVDVLFLGDSSCLMSLRSVLFERLTGYPAWNLGTLGWLSTEGHAELLSLYLENHAPPRLIIYNVSTYPLTVLQSDISGVGYLDTFQKWLGLDKAVSRFHFPSYRERYFLRWQITKRFLSSHFLQESRGPFPSDSEIHRLLQENRGSLDDPRHDNLGTVTFPSIALSTDCIPGLLHLFSLTDQYEIPLLVVLNPLPIVARTPQLDIELGQLSKDLFKLTQGHPRVKIHTPLARYIPLRDFSSLNHLNPEGAKRNTRELATWVIPLKVKEHSIARQTRL
jgi:hypothetical protein